MLSRQADQLPSCLAMRPLHLAMRQVSVAEAEKTAERLQLYEEKMKRIRENNPAQVSAAPCTVQ